MPNGSRWDSYIELKICDMDEGLRYSYYCTEMRRDGPRRIVEGECEVASNIGASARRTLEHMRKRMKGTKDEHKAFRRRDLVNLVRALQLSRA